MDTITESGPNKILLEGTDRVLINSRQYVLTTKHHSKVLAFVKKWNKEIHVLGFG